MEKELMKKVKEINILNVDENSVVVVHLDITTISNRDIDSYVAKIMKLIKPVFKKRGADIIVVPFRGEPKSKFEIIKKNELKVGKSLSESKMDKGEKNTPPITKKPPEPKGQCNTKWSPSGEKMLNNIGNVEE